MWVFKVCYRQLRTKHSIKRVRIAVTMHQGYKASSQRFQRYRSSLKSEIQLLWARAGSILLLTFSPHNLMFYTRALYRRFLGKYDLFFAPGSLGSTACREDPRLGYPARSYTWGAYTICQNKPVGMTVE